MIEHRNYRVEYEPSDGTLSLRRWKVLADESTDGFQSYWEGVEIARFHTNPEAVAFAKACQERALG